MWRNRNGNLMISARLCKRAHIFHSASRQHSRNNSTATSAADRFQAMKWETRADIRWCSVYVEWEEIKSHLTCCCCFAHSRKLRWLFLLMSQLTREGSNRCWTEKSREREEKRIGKDKRKMHNFSATASARPNEDIISWWWCNFRSMLGCCYNIFFPFASSKRIV